jgi:LysM repeat protein
LLSGASTARVSAQTPEPTPVPTFPVEPPFDSEIQNIHVVQAGETLSSISELYGTDVDALQLLNNITDPSLIFVGQEIRLPVDDGESVITTRIVQLGDSLPGLAAQYRTSVVEIAAQNRMISVNNLVAGRPIVVNSLTGSTEPEALLGEPHIVEPGESLLTVAAQHRLSPAAIIDANDLHHPAYLFPGQRLRIPGHNSFQFLSTGWNKVSMVPLPLFPGSSAAIMVESGQEMPPVGEFLDQKLQFASFGDGFIALVGMDAFTDSGAYEITLNQANDENGAVLSQQVFVEPGGFITQSITIPEDKVSLLDPEIRRSEDEFLAAIYDDFTNEPLWDPLYHGSLLRCSILQWRAC